MHPRGAVFDAVVERYGSGSDHGVPWLDEAATAPAGGRLSRGPGRPAPRPDRLGRASGRPGGGSPGDLLLTSTGRGPLSRLLPLPRRDSAAGYSSIMGYPSHAGSPRLAALPEADRMPSEPAPLAGAVRRAGLRFILAVARGTGPWQPFATLILTDPVRALAPDVQFDAVQTPPPGLVPDGPMARFRAPSYARARAARGRALTRWSWSQVRGR